MLEWRVEVVLEPFKTLMMIMGMGVKGSGEAESWLGKATGVESEISGTVEKNRGGKKNPKEIAQTQEGKEEGKTDQECDSRINLTEPRCDENPSRNKRGNEKPTPSWSNTWSSLSLATQGQFVPAAQQQMLLVSCPHRPTPS